MKNLISAQEVSYFRYNLFMTEKDRTVNLPPGYYTACGGRIMETDRYPSTMYQGQKIYFCNNACFEAFKADPDRFLAGEIEHPLDQH